MKSTFFSIPFKLLALCLLAFALVGFGQPEMAMATPVVAAAAFSPSFRISTPLVFVGLVATPIFAQASGGVPGDGATIVTAGLSVLFTLDQLKEAARPYFEDVKNKLKDTIYATSDGAFFWQESFAKTHIFEWRKFNPKQVGEEPTLHTITRAELFGEPEQVPEADPDKGEDGQKAMPDTNLSDAIVAAVSAANLELGDDTPEVPAVAETDAVTPATALPPEPAAKTKKGHATTV